MKRKIKNWLAVFLALICCICIGTGTVTAQNTAPLNEGFEDGIPGTWTVLDIASANGNSWEIVGLGHTGDYAVSKSWDCDGGTETYLITPQLLPSDGNHTLSFYLGTDYPEDAANTTFTIEVSTTGTSASDFTSIAEITFPGESGEWEEKTVDLSAYIGQPIYIAFHYIDDCGTLAMIDDVSGVDYIAPSCVEPTTVTVNNITSSTATVSWVNNEVNIDAPANVQYTLATDTEWENAETVGNIAGTSTLIEGLTPNTNYKVRVQSVCGGSEVSAWKEGTFKTTCIEITSFP